MVTELEKRMAEAIHKKYGGDRLTALATVMDLKDIIDKCLGSNDWDEGYNPGVKVPTAPDSYDHSLPGDDGYTRVDKICYWAPPHGVRIVNPCACKSNWNIHDRGRVIVGAEPKKPPEKLGWYPNSKMIASQNGDIELFSHFPWTFFVEICNGVRLDVFEGVIHPDGSGTIGLRRSAGKEVLHGDLFVDQMTSIPRHFSIQASVPRRSRIAEDLISTGLHYDPRESSCVQVSFIKANI